MLNISDEIENYPVAPPYGQWNWFEDADMARTYHQWITNGWPKDTHGYPVSYGGETYP